MHESKQRLLSRRDVGGLTLLEVGMEAGARVPIANFPNACFQYVVSGGYEEPSADAERRPFSVHFHPAEDPQDAVVHRRTRIFGICIPGERMEIISRFGGLPGAPADLSQPRIIKCMASLREELAQNDAASVLAIEGLVCELLAVFSRSSDRLPLSIPKWLKAVHDLINEEPQVNRSLNSLSEECAVHPAHLARCFRRHYGCSVGECLRSARLRLASSLLSSTDLTLEEIALRTGFYDASHLSRTIKDRWGVNPKALRQDRC